MDKLLKQNEKNVPVRRYGRTNYAMPIFSCGGMRFQQGWDKTEAISKESQKNVESCLEYAFDLGINHFETAFGYGTSQVQMGKILPKFDREKIIVQTKVGPNNDIKAFKEAFEECFTNLKLPYLDLLSIHGINDQATFDMTMKKGGCLDVAKEFVKEGRVRHIGFSTHGWCGNICQTINTGEFDYVNMHWYFVNNLNEQALIDAKKQDMGVMILSPNDKGGKLYEAPEKLKKLCGDIDPMLFNDLFCLSNDNISTLTQGVSKPSDFDLHMQAIDMYEDRHEISSRIANTINSEIENVLGDGWVNNWHKGIPEFYDIPGNINVLEVVRLWTYAKSLDMVEFAKMRYNLLGNGGSWFPGVKPNKIDKPAMLKVLKDSWLGGKKIIEILEDAVLMLRGVEVKRLSKD